MQKSKFFNGKNSKISLQEKRGISAVVATVLIILITVVAVSIVWAFVMPMVNKNTFANVGSDAKLSIVTSEGYTVFEKERQIASVQIKRGEDDARLARLNILFEVNGSSEAFKTKVAPNVNEAKIYWFNFSKYPDLKDKIPKYVSVVPVYLKDGVEVLGSVADKIEMPIKKISTSAEDIQTGQVKSPVVKVNRRGGGGEEDGGRDIVDNTGGNEFCDSDDDCGFSERCAGTCNLFITEIDKCDEGESQITNPGIYKIISNLESDTTCLTVTSDEVILDINGFNIKGENSGYGVYVNNNDNVTIKNGTIYNFYNGIYLLNNQKNTIQNTATISNHYGIHLYSSSDNTIKNNNITDNDISGNGIILEHSDSNLISDNFGQNNRNGIILNSGSSHNKINKNNIVANKYNSIALLRSSYNNITNNNASGNIGVVWNGGGGIIIGWNSLNNLIKNNIANNNKYVGISIQYSSNRNIVKDNLVNSNTNYGVVIMVSSLYNQLKNMTINSNRKGIYIYDSSKNNITNITTTNNQYGFYISGGSNNLILINNSRACDNSVKDFYCISDSAYGENIYDLKTGCNAIASSGSC